MNINGSTYLFYRCIHHKACSRMKVGSRAHFCCKQCPHFLDEDTYTDTLPIVEVRKYLSDGKRLVRLGVCSVDEAFTIRDFGRGDTLGDIISSLTGQERSVQV